MITDTSLFIGWVLISSSSLFLILMLSLWINSFIVKHTVIRKANRALRRDSDKSYKELAKQNEEMYAERLLAFAKALRKGDIDTSYIEKEANKILKAPADFWKKK